MLPAACWADHSLVQLRASPTRSTCLFTTGQRCLASSLLILAVFITVSIVPLNAVFTDDLSIQTEVEKRKT